VKNTVLFAFKNYFNEVNIVLSSVLGLNAAILQGNKTGPAH
jgi:hypothetical protein